MKRLDGKVAIVTGSGQGIGQSVSLALADDGAAVAVVGRTEAKLLDTCEQIERAGGTAAPFVCDVTDADQVERCVAAVAERFEALDILVNNAQDFPRAPLIDTDDEVIFRVFYSGPFAAVRFMRAAYPYLKARGTGVIINMGSGAQYMHEPRNFGAYVAAKWAMTGFSRTAAAEWGKDGIRSYLVTPAAWTPMSIEGRRRNPEVFDALIATIPLGRMGDGIKDIGRPICWLCTDEASYLTGTTIQLDGGQFFLH